MSKYRHYLVILIFILALLSAASMHAQEQNEGYSIQFLSNDEDGSVVSHNPFPDVEVKFLIMKDGISEQTPWPSNLIRVLEDDREIQAEGRVYGIEKQPLDVTVVYHFVEYTDIDNDGPHIEILRRIKSEYENDIRIRSLCLTMVSDVYQKPCNSIGANESLVNDFNIRTDFTRRDIVNSIRRVNNQVIWDSILADRVPGRPHQVIWIIDDDILTHSGIYGDLLPVDESQLARLDEADVPLIFMDLTPSDDLQLDVTWKALLGAFDIQHLMHVGANRIQNQTCVIWRCMRDLMELQRPLIHTLKYKSPLFVDSGQHSLRVQLLASPDSNGTGQTIAAQQRVDFVISPPYQVEETELRGGVRWFSMLFNGIAMIVLISVLVLIKRPQDAIS